MTRSFVVGIYRRFGNERIDTAFFFGSVERIPAWVAERTWVDASVGAGDVDGCESRRRPGPSLSGAESLAGRLSDGT